MSPAVSRAPEVHPNLPDVSYAGYRQSEQTLPAPLAVANVRDLGARGNGRDDDTPGVDAEQLVSPGEGHHRPLVDPDGDVLLEQRDGVVRSGLGREGLESLARTAGCEEIGDTTLVGDQHANAARPCDDTDARA